MKTKCRSLRWWHMSWCSRNPPFLIFLESQVLTAVSLPEIHILNIYLIYLVIQKQKQFIVNWIIKIQKIISKIKYFEQMIRRIFIITQFYGIPALKQAYFLKPRLVPWNQWRKKIAMIPYTQHVTIGPLRKAHLSANLNEKLRKIYYLLNSLFVDFQILK